MIWPPQFSIRKSKRARHVGLKISNRGELELIVPERFDPELAVKFLHEKRPWVEKQLAQIKARWGGEDPDALPQVIELRAISGEWQVEYVPCAGKLRLLKRPLQLVVSGDIEDRTGCRQLLSRWVRRMAKQHLEPMLDAVAEETGLCYSRLSVRSQQTRWGSCTPAGVINLNDRLLFLPLELARHVMIHELCHTIHLNHGKRFWAQVAKFDPDWKAHDRALSQAHRHMPLWLL